MFIRLAVAVALALGLMIPAGAAHAAPGCSGSWSLGIGGLRLSLVSSSWENSDYMQADDLVGYDSLNPRSGLVELDRMYRQHRAACPADHVKVIGHSEGAGIAHAWVTENQDEQNVSAVLLADPKQSPAGLSGHPLGVLIGYPLAGTDAEFGSVPVLQVCHWTDVVCNRPAGWLGYVTGAHTSYDTNADHYPENASGVRYR